MTRRSSSIDRRPAGRVALHKVGDIARIDPTAGPLTSLPTTDLVVFEPILVANLPGRAFLAVQGFGQDAGDCGLAGAAWPREEEGMGHPPRCDGVGQGLRDVLLRDDIGEGLGPVFSG